MRSFAESFGVPATVVRLFSVYGPGLRKQMLWDTCRRLRETTGPLSLAGTGDACRDWLHVSDAVRILQHAACVASQHCPVIYGATGVPVTVREIANALHEAFGRNERAVFTGVVRAGDVRYGVSNAS